MGRCLKNIFMVQESKTGISSKNIAGIKIFHDIQGRSAA
jgi:hypothetical protein